MVGRPVYKECPECSGKGTECVEYFYAFLFFPCTFCGGKGEVIVFTTIESLESFNSDCEVFDE